MHILCDLTVSSLQIVRPKSIPKYKYLSALGVRVFANAVRFGLTCMSKIDGVCMLPVVSCPSFCFLRSKVVHATGRLTIGFHGEATGHLLYATGHLWCGFLALILEGVAAIQLPE